MECPNCGCKMDSEMEDMEKPDMEESSDEDSSIKSSVLDELMSAMDESMAEKLPKKGMTKIDIIAMKPKKKED